jgi:lysophospholipid hydrolase
MSTPPSPDPFSTGPSATFNGYHLLNEVSTGGTLSSLFSILSLFTEDVKLSWSPDRTQDETPEEQIGAEVGVGRPPGKSRTNSDVSQLDEGIMGKDHLSGSEMRSVPIPALRPRSMSDSSAGKRSHRDSMSSAGDDSTIRDSTSDSGDGNVDEEIEEGETTLGPEGITPDLGTDPLAPGLSSRSSPASKRGRAHSLRPDSTRPLAGEGRSKLPKLGPTALSGTIARATVDTTLAVIPAEAFRKLTRKYPKASGTIVQVVLERFSRVTFMTGKSLPHIQVTSGAYGSS